VYALGNAVTGRGNINQSLKHATQISQLIIDELLTKDTKTNSTDALKETVHQWQNKVKYNRDYSDWISKHMPTRLEDMIEH